jgi:tetratricopeptide (TPR) repeat protein
MRVKAILVAWKPGRAWAKGMLMQFFRWLLFLLIASSARADADAPTFPKLSDEATAEVNGGVVFFKDAKFKEAEEAFRKVTELAPNHPVGWINLGSVEYRLGESDQAADHLRRAVFLDPTAQQAWLTLGIIEYQKDHLDASLAALSQAVYLDPKDPKAHLYLGILVRKKGWLSGAEDEMRKAIELDESYAEAHYNLAVLCLEQRPPAIELAKRHYFQALRLGAKADPELDQTFKK